MHFEKERKKTGPFFAKLEVERERGFFQFFPLTKTDKLLEDISVVMITLHFHKRRLGMKKGEGKLQLKLNYFFPSIHCSN